MPQLKTPAAYEIINIMIDSLKVLLSDSNNRVAAFLKSQSHLFVVL
jgi:hypothetical protein